MPDSIPAGSLRLTISRSILERQIPDRAPVINRQARQMLTPRAACAPLVEVPQKQDESDQSTEQRCATKQPPRPPDAAAIQKESERLLDETE